MTQRIPKRLSGLTRQCAPRPVGNRAGNHQRQGNAGFGKNILHRMNRRFGVERVENRLNQNDIGGALNQAARRLGVRAA